MWRSAMCVVNSGNTNREINRTSKVFLTVQRDVDKVEEPRDRLVHREIYNSSGSARVAHRRYFNQFDAYITGLNGAMLEVLQKIRSA